MFNVEVATNCIKQYEEMCKKTHLFKKEMNVGKAYNELLMQFAASLDEIEQKIDRLMAAMKVN